MQYVSSLPKLRVPFVASFAFATLTLAPSLAGADTIEWLATVNASTPAATFVSTNITTPSIIDIGALSGDITYEFLVNGSDRAAAGTLIGSLANGQSQAIRFEQWQNTGAYGATQYFVGDYSFGVPTTFDEAVVLAFVVNSAAGTTSLFVNGVDTGTTVPMALTLSGLVGFGGTAMPGGGFLGDDAFAGTILGFAAFDSALSAEELKTHADTFALPTAIPEPTTLTLLAFGMVGIAGRRWKQKQS